ncbi:MAG: porin, partial [Prevotella shahii]|nr:porin [Hoylesella shahii]
VGVDCELSKMLKLSAEYARVNDKSLKTPNYNLIDFQVGLRF